MSETIITAAPSTNIVMPNFIWYRGDENVNEQPKMSATSGIVDRNCILYDVATRTIFKHVKGSDNNVILGGNTIFGASYGAHNEVHNDISGNIIHKSDNTGITSYSSAFGLKNIVDYTYNGGGVAFGHYNAGGKDAILTIGNGLSESTRHNIVAVNYNSVVISYGTNSSNTKEITFKDGSINVGGDVVVEGTIYGNWDGTSKYDEEIEKIKATNAAQDESIKTLTSNVENNKSSITALNNSVSVLTTKAAEAEKKIGYNTSSISALNNSISTINNNITIIKATNAAQDTKIAELKNSVDNVNSSITALSNSVTELVTKTDEMKSTITALDADIVSIKATNAAQDNSITILTSNVNKLGNSVSALEKTINSTIKPQLADITTTVNFNTNTINNTIIPSLSYMEDKINELISELNNSTFITKYTSYFSYIEFE